MEFLARQTLVPVKAAGSFLVPGLDEWGIVGATATFTHVTANTVRAFRFSVKVPITIDRISFKGSSAQAGAFYAAGIYSADGNTKHVDTGAIDGNTGWVGMHNVTVTAFTLLPVVFYWLVDTTSSNNVQLYLMILNANFADVLNGVVACVGTAANASSSGVLPSTLGTITAAALTTAPFIKLSHS